MSALKSRILQFIPEKLLNELNKICRDVTISDNNIKVDLMVAVLDRYDIDYNELGPGTNRFAILIDGYVFKIAMDRLGVIDNWAEFSLTQELQPFVIKVYECNGLIIVTEYVTVISKDEFIKNKDAIKRILSSIADKYLLGDVGTVPKNFMNWGYRDNGELTILDFAYVYRIQGEEMICGGKNKAGDECHSFLMYDDNFYNLICPVCNKKYIFTDIRSKIDPDYEKREVAMIKQIAELVTEPMTDIGTPDQDVAPVNVTVNQLYNISEGDEDTMDYKNDKFSDEELENSYANALDFLKHGEQIQAEADTLEEILPAPIIFDMEKVDETAEEIVEDLDGDELEANNDSNENQDNVSGATDFTKIDSFVAEYMEVEVNDEDIDFYMSMDYKLIVRQNDSDNCIDVNYPQFPMLGIVHSGSEDGAIEEMQNRLRMFIRDCLKTRNNVPLPQADSDNEVSYNEIFNLDPTADINAIVESQMEQTQEKGEVNDESTKENSGSVETSMEYSETVSSVTVIPSEESNQKNISEPIIERDQSDEEPTEDIQNTTNDATIIVAKTTETIESTIVVETSSDAPPVAVEKIDKKVDSFIQVIPADNSDALRDELRNSLGTDEHFSEEEQAEFDEFYEENIREQQRSKYGSKKKPLVD